MPRFKLKEHLEHWRAAFHKLEHRTILRVTTISHLAYYGLVSVEAHGNYRYAAGAIGVLLVVEAFTGTGESGGAS